MRTFITWLISGALLAAFAWWLAEATEPLIVDASPAPASTEFTVQRPHFREFDVNGVSLEATAVTATYRQLSSLVDAELLKATVYRNNRPTFVYAGKAHYNLGDETAVLSENVRIENEQGYTMHTTSAVYRHEIETVTADGPFSAEGPGLYLEGVGLEYQLRSDAFSVKQNVGASISGFRL